mmetsp:Transcript_33772/g.88467  ORF Transcript_33772/g.88467 Transcript_33772/m.88467 type:complete len:380 (+) Transcript_33772:1252-2391(+)
MACSAVYRTRGCGWFTCCRSSFAISSTWGLSSMYSHVCLTAASAACFACHGSWPTKCATSWNSEVPRASMPTASTTLSIDSSPAWKSSSSSSSPSSSSIRAAQASSSSLPSSTSTIRCMHAWSASGAREGRFFVAHLALFSTKVTSHSSARPRRPSSTPSRVFATSAMKFAGSMLLASSALKKSGSTEATSISAWMASCSNSVSAAWASRLRTCTSTASVAVRGAQAFFCVSPTISQISSKEAAWILRVGLESPAWRIWDSSCCAPTISSFSVGTNSFIRRIADSQDSGLGDVPVLAMRNTCGSSAGHPHGAPGARLPRGSSLSQTYSTSLAMISPIFFCSFGWASASNLVRSSAATCCWLTAVIRDQTKSFSEPFIIS